jgi:hypothetical protein
VWAPRGAGTIDLGRMAGPTSGLVEPPEHLRPDPSRCHYDVSDPVDRVALYRSVLTSGTAEDVYRLVDLAALVDCFDDLRLPAHVGAPWRRAMRDASLT